MTSNTAASAYQVTAYLKWLLGSGRRARPPIGSPPGHRGQAGARRHGRCVDIVPDAGIGIVLGNPVALAPAGAQDPDDRDAAPELARRARRRIAHGERHPAAIDQHQRPAVAAQRRDHVQTGRAPKAARAKQEFLVMEEYPGHPHAANFRLHGVIGNLREFEGRGGMSGVAFGDQPLFPVQPLDLPRPESEQRREDDKRHQGGQEGWPEPAARSTVRHDIRASGCDSATPPESPSSAATISAPAPRSTAARSAHAPTWAAAPCFRAQRPAE